MRNSIIQSQIAGQAFALCPRVMDSLLVFANQDTPRAESVSQVANNSVTYEKQSNVAVISVDGGMYKKDIGGMCSSVASYDQMVKFIDSAENDPSVDTIFFRVDTPGGSVAGADEVGDKIFNSKKRTVCLYENIGASGGIWVFSACDELYATETTILGSIGVIVSYMEPTGDTGMRRVSIVSKNAENKDCSLKGDCLSKTQGMLDAYEAMFYSRIERNTGFTSEQIQTVFNNGDVIFATEAKKAGFIKDVTTFDALFSSLKLGATPTASVGNKSTITYEQGADMDDSTFMAKLKSVFGVTGVEGADMQTSAIVTLQMSLDEANAALATQTEAYKALEQKVTEAENFKTEVMTRLAEASHTGVSVAVAMQMIEATSAEEASRIALDAKTSQGATMQADSQDGKVVDKSKMSLREYAEMNKGSVR